MRAVSMIANRSAKKTGATSANSMMAEPCWLRRKRRKTLLAVAVEAAGIAENPQGGKNICRQY
ncbi:MAG: hypothetical protein ACXWKP_26885 [Bradyrhizobium sp.]